MRETEQETTALRAETTPSLTMIFDLLSNPQRRYALYYMYEQPDGVATMDELVEAVIELQEASCEGPTADADDTSETTTRDTDPDHYRRQVQTELRHTHLPKLEDAGVLEHDHRSETVRYWSQPSLEEWLEHAHHKEL